MKRRLGDLVGPLLAGLLLLLLPAPGFSRPEGPGGDPVLDQKVREFLDANRRQWRDMNVPAADGEALHDLILEHGYTRALEIGTSTGHSGIWIAWALSRTGGHLTTLEIDPERHARAVENFREAGLAQYVNARLGDAHEIVPELSGPFDFIFVDADKEWTTNYFKALAPKLAAGGCFASHNVGMRGVDEFLDYVRTLPDFETRIHPVRKGISLSFRKGDP